MMQAWSAEDPVQRLCTYGTGLSIWKWFVRGTIILLPIVWLSFCGWFLLYHRDLMFCPDTIDASQKTLAEFGTVSSLLTLALAVVGAIIGICEAHDKFTGQGGSYFGS